jgi:[ribosomal protein S5]-alanine N-acetyltransferase
MITTKNLRLIPWEQAHHLAYLSGKAELAAILKVRVPVSWPHFPEAYTHMATAALAEELSTSDWHTYFFVHPQQNVLVGSGGFYGEPDSDGTVELGYEIATEYWNQGFGTEAVQAMIYHAFAHPAVQAVRAHTLAEPNASNRLLQKVGMKFVSSHEDPDEGDVWRWEINREGGAS